MSNYTDRGELVSTDSESFDLGDTTYRISTSVRYNGEYRITISLLKLRSSTPHDTIDSNFYRVQDKENVQETITTGVEWARERAEAQEDARALSVSVDVDVGDDDE